MLFLIYNYVLLSKFHSKILKVISFSLNRLTCTTNHIPLKPIAILYILLLTSPSYHHYLPQNHKSHSTKAHPTLSTLLLTSPSNPQYLPKHHKSHSPKSFYNSLHPSEKFSISPQYFLSTTNIIPLRPFIILFTLVLISPSHPQYLPQQHKSLYPKALYIFLHPPVNFSISPHNISLSTTFLNSSLTIKPVITFKNYT